MTEWNAPGSTGDHPSDELADAAQRSAPASAPILGAPATAAVAPPPGWYADPEDGTRQRYWDGAAWAAPMTAIPAAAPAKRGLSRGAVAGIVAGVVAVVVLGIVAAAVVLPRLEGAALSAIDGAGATSLEADVPDAWTTVATLEGAGTIGYDPTWDDVRVQLGASTIEALTLQETGIDVRVDGAWMMEGSWETGGSALTVMSAADVGGPSSARLEAEAFLLSSTAELEDVMKISEGAVETAAGYTAYVIEFGYSLYGERLTNTVGVVVEGPRQVIVSASSLEQYGTQVDVVQAMLSSLTIDEA
ncbi:DUF2510 domain-containing protein [uncultured Demequina sp.]|uniref:DUF2510 domain-containing protein n=1 Tax=uncultured Demequina sp. TaxID=693499 RepID=UPI0025D12D88|nr:DUF2510 domain-containing protein [uncultured Demequina sp.]